LIPSAAFVRPKVLQWKVDSELSQGIESASVSLHCLIKTIELKVLGFPHFGRNFAKRCDAVTSCVSASPITWSILHRRFSITPDFFMQMAIQLAYFRLHKEVVATYETAHLRLFYHGRTETGREYLYETYSI
jgi:hypothetical protein